MVSIIPRVDLLGNTGGLNLQTFIFLVGHRYPIFGHTTTAYSQPGPSIRSKTVLYSLIVRPALLSKDNPFSDDCSALSAP